MTTFTRERLEQIANFHSQMTLPPSHAEIEELARIALAAIQQEPLYQVLNSGGWRDVKGDIFEALKAEGLNTRILYTSQPAPIVLDDVLARIQHEANHVTAWHHMDEHSCKVNRRDLLTLVNACRAAMLQAGNSPVIPEEKGSSLQLRNLIRKRHAEWSETTFGNVGPIGPLKHLSKEALEAADDVDDLSEWADMQFLLWDAQRRAGISDGEITAAMEEKLKVNMARQWPEPKDGEPRLHIKDAGDSPVIQDGWISCSERMPEESECVLIWDGRFRKVSFTMYGHWQVLEPETITHWHPLPAAPQQ